jgi:hypothetical protein
MRVFLPLVLLFLAGCAEFHTVSILVQNETKVPLSGVVVTTVYTPEPFSLAFRKQERATTGHDGIAFLRANYLKREPTLWGRSDSSFVPEYCVDTPGYLSTDFYPSPNDVEHILARGYGGRPSTPDVIINLTAEPVGTVHPPCECAQPSFIKQLGYDFGDAWRWLTSPFRRAQPID